MTPQVNLHRGTVDVEPAVKTIASFSERTSLVLMLDVQNIDTTTEIRISFEDKYARVIADFAVTKVTGELFVSPNVSLDQGGMIRVWSIRGNPARCQYSIQSTTTTSKIGGFMDLAKAVGVDTSRLTPKLAEAVDAALAKRNAQLLANQSADPLTIECPACHAQRGIACRIHGTGIATQPHPSRVERAKEGPMLKPGQLMGLTSAGHYVPVTDKRKAIGVVRNDPTVDGIAQLDIYQGAEHIAGGSVVDTKPSTRISATEGDTLAIALPAGIKPPLERVNPMTVKPLEVIVGPITDMTSGRVVIGKDIRATVLRTELVNDPQTKIFDHINMRLRRWDTDALVNVDIQPRDRLRIDPHPEEP